MHYCISSLHLNVIHSNRLCVSSDRLPGPADRAGNILSSVRKPTKISYSPHLIPAGGRFSQLDQSFAILLLYETPATNYLSAREPEIYHNQLADLCLRNSAYSLQTVRSSFILFTRISNPWKFPMSPFWKRKSSLYFTILNIPLESFCHPVVNPFFSHLSSMK